MPQIEATITKSPSEWATGEQPMTSRQRWFLRDLCQKAGEPLDEKLTKSQASKEIERLKAMSQRTKTE